MPEYYLGLGLWQLEAQDGSQTIELRDIPALCEAIGEDALANFSRAFAAIDRLNTLVYLIGLNRRACPPVGGVAETAHDPDSVAAARNDWHLVVLIWSAMREVHQVIRDLAATDIGATLQDPIAMQAWDRLQEVQQRWAADRLARTFRNEIGAHFGELETHREGLRRWPAIESLQVRVGGTSYAHSRYVLPALLVMRRYDVSMEDFVRLANQGVQDQEILSDSIHKVFLGVLHSNGAHVRAPFEIWEREQNP